MIDEIKDWKIVKSKSGKHPIGYPYGEYLCRDEQAVKECMEMIHDPVVIDYVKKD